MNFMQLIDNQCCNAESMIHEQGIDSDTKEDSENKGCNGITCDCVCCVHLMVKSSVPNKATTAPITFDKRQSIYQNNYIMLYQNLVWHPPRKVQ